MAAVAQPAEQVTELLQSLKVDSQPTAGDAADVPPNVDGDTSDGSVEASASGGFTDMAVGGYEGCFDTGMYYAPNGYAVPHGFYYGGYECPVGDWDDYSQHVGIDGLEVQAPASDFYGVYSENGSLLYHAAGYGYTQPVYSPYTHGTPIPANGQLYGPPAYPYPGHIYQQPVLPGGQFIPSAAPVTVDLPTNAADSNNTVLDGTSGALANGNNVATGPRPPYPVTLVPSAGPYGHGMLPMNMPNPASQDGRVGYEGLRAGAPWPDVSKLTDSQQRHGISQPLPLSGLPGQTLQSVTPMLTHVSAGQQPRVPSGVSPLPATVPRLYQTPARIYTGSAPGRGQGLGISGFEPRGNGCGWVVVDKGKPRGRGNGSICNGNGNGNLDILNEQNRGPRTNRIRNQRTPPGAFRFIRGQGFPNENADALDTLTSKEQYNRSDFSTSYECAKFFIIKSYSEDDIHKSIKYNVWASTPNGNKKLDAAYQEAQEKAGHCPVFLFFSVNASGQFCGVAEMVGPVDFSKSMDFWQQDKWNGRFPVKWHIIKDVPNNQFRHIILANNDNKPVTNSRDTQEVKFEQGVEMLNLFKNYVFKTSILDDFQFYENRQKAMQEKKARQQLHTQFQQEETPSMTQGEKLEIEGCGDKSSKVKDAQLGTISPQAVCNGTLTEEGKLLSRPIEKRESPIGAGMESENAKSCNESKDAGAGNVNHLKDSIGKK